MSYSAKKLWSRVETQDTVYIETMGHTHIETLKPPTLFQETLMEMKLVLAHNDSFIEDSTPHHTFVQHYNSFNYVHSSILNPIIGPLSCFYFHFYFIFDDWAHISLL